jgi:hypothetical protein
MKSLCACVGRRLMGLSLAASLVALGAAGCDDGKSTTTVKETPHAAETTKNMENFMKNQAKAAPAPTAPRTK